jgi:hypothetical protein
MCARVYVPKVHVYIDDEKREMIDAHSFLPITQKEWETRWKDLKNVEEERHPHVFDIEKD